MHLSVENCFPLKSTVAFDQNQYKLMSTVNTGCFPNYLNFALINFRSKKPVC